MASLAAEHEPGIAPGSGALADGLVPASIFAPDRGGCGEEDGDECLEDGDMTNGKLEDRRIDCSSKVTLGLDVALLS